jgi:rhamnosyltransferase
MSTCSIVIRCYNEAAHIGKLLDGILAQTLDDVEIIVVDSGSTDGTLDIVAQYPATVVKIPKEEFSFGRSLNLGCEAANGDFIVIASAHVYPVYSDWLAQMLAPFKNPKIALTYGKQRGAPVTKYAEHRIFARWFPDESDLRQAHPFCNNANAAIRRELWQEIAYDEDITGLEDLDWAKKWVERGLYIAYNAKAEIIHVHNESFRQVYNRYFREAIAFKRIYPEAHFSWWDVLRLIAFNVINDMSHAARDGVLSKEWLNILKFRWMQFTGTKRGYDQHNVTAQLRRTFYYPEIKRGAEIDPAREQLRIDYDDNSRTLVK